MITPGPWQMSTGAYEVWGPEGPGHGLVASTNPNNMAYHGNEEGQRHWADAKLIAAAPELLEALNGLFEHCAMVHRRWGEGANQQEADTAIASAHAAIAKATGGAL